MHVVPTAQLCVHPICGAQPAPLVTIATYTIYSSLGFCYGITHITNPTAIISDHSGYGDYQPYSHCEWYITPSNSAHSIKLRFTFFDTELSNDTVIYSNVTTN